MELEKKKGMGEAGGGDRPLWYSSTQRNSEYYSFIVGPLSVIWSGTVPTHCSTQYTHTPNTLSLSILSGTEPVSSLSAHTRMTLKMTSSTVKICVESWNHVHSISNNSTVRPLVVTVYTNVVVVCTDWGRRFHFTNEPMNELKKAISTFSLKTGETHTRIYTYID